MLEEKEMSETGIDAIYLHLLDDLIYRWFQSEGMRSKALSIEKVMYILRSVMWIRIRSDPHSFWSVDPDPEVYNEGKSRV